MFKIQNVKKLIKITDRSTVCEKVIGFYNMSKLALYFPNQNTPKTLVIKGHDS